VSDDEEPLDPVRVTLFVLFLAGLGFGAWRLYVGRTAVAAVKEATKDYRKLFPSRADEVAPPVPATVLAAAPQKSGMMLKIDEDMKPAKRESAASPPPKEPEPAAISAAAAKTVAAPKKTAAKPFNPKGLNSVAFSRLHGGSGLGFSGGSSGGGGGTPTAGGEPGAAGGGDPGAAAADAMKGLDLSKIPGMPAGGITGMPSETDQK
jgi:hypothetical protein